LNELLGEHATTVLPTRQDPSQKQPKPGEGGARRPGTIPGTGRSEPRTDRLRCPGQRVSPKPTTTNSPRRAARTCPKWNWPKRGKRSAATHQNACSTATDPITGTQLKRKCF